MMTKKTTAGTIAAETTAQGDRGEAICLPVRIQVDYAIAVLLLLGKETDVLVSARNSPNAGLLVAEVCRPLHVNESFWHPLAPATVLKSFFR